MMIIFKILFSLLCLIIMVMGLYSSPPFRHLSFLEKITVIGTDIIIFIGFICVLFTIWLK